MNTYYLKHPNRTEKIVTESEYRKLYNQRITGTLSKFEARNGTKGRIEKSFESASNSQEDKKEQDSSFGLGDFGFGSSGSDSGGGNDFGGGGGDFGGGGSSDSF